ncbi:MAG: hypothetical protein ABI432_00395 [Flavobacteriales bacterium]
MERPSERTLKEHHAYYSADGPFAANARMLQGVWARAQGLPLAERAFKNGMRKLAPLCNYVDPEHALHQGSNFLTEGIRCVVREEMKANAARKGPARKVFRADRLYGDLLNSQSLAFNLFGELKLDLEMATRVFRYMRPDHVDTVIGLEFEHAPRLGVARSNGDRSTFAVFVEYLGPRGRGFIGMEVKYAESLSSKPVLFRERYWELAEASGQFRPGSLETLRTMPLGVEQLWRAHLLCLELGPPVGTTYAAGCFMFLYPQDNFDCQIAVNRYQKMLSGSDSFLPFTMEEYCWALRSVKAGDWVDELVGRYLSFSRNLVPVIIR